MSSVAARSAREVSEAHRLRLTGKSKERSVGSLVFLGALWFSLFFGVAVLLVLIIDTAIAGAGRFDLALLTNYESRLNPETTGFRAGILGSLWLMVATIVLCVPLGISAAVYLEEFADTNTWYNRLIEVNLQNLAAVPAIVYGLLATSVMAVLGFQKGIVLGGAVALALLILPVVIITTREAVRAVPEEIRQGSLALGATKWQTTWRQILPSSIPGISTGTILGLSRAIGEAAPLVIVGLPGLVRWDPAGLQSLATDLPMQIYKFAQDPSADFQEAASAAIIVLLVMVLGLNAVAIIIRNKFQRSW